MLLCRGLQTGRGLLLGEEPHLVQVAGARLLVIWRTELGFLDTRCGGLIIITVTINIIVIVRYSDDYGETWGPAGLSPRPLTYSGTLDPEVVLFITVARIESRFNHNQQ